LDRGKDYGGPKPILFLVVHTCLYGRPSDLGASSKGAPDSRVFFSAQRHRCRVLTWRWPSGTLVTLLERCGSLTPARYAVRTKPLQGAILKEQDDPDF